MPISHGSESIQLEAKVQRDAMLISFDELARLSNRSKPSAVRRWCQQRGISWLPDADGRPTTSERAYNEALQRGRATRPHYQ